MLYVKKWGQSRAKISSEKCSLIKEIDNLYEKLVKEYKIKWKVTEELKQKDQMKLVQMMNNMKNYVNEIIIKEIISIDI